MDLNTMPSLLHLLYCLLVNVYGNNQVCLPTIKWTMQKGYINSTELPFVPKTTLPMCVDDCRKDLMSDIVFYNQSTNLCHCFINTDTPYYAMASESHIKLETVIAVSTPSK